MTNGEYEWYVCIKPIHEFVKGKMYKLTVGHTPSGTIGFDPAFVNSYFRKATLEEICDVGSVWPKGYAAAFAKKVGGDIPEGQIETLRKWCQFILDVTKPEEKSPVLSNSSNTGKDEVDDPSFTKIEAGKCYMCVESIYDHTLDDDGFVKGKIYRATEDWKFGDYDLSKRHNRPLVKCFRLATLQELSHQEVTKIGDQDNFSDKLTKFEKELQRICECITDTSGISEDWIVLRASSLLSIARKQFVEEACEYLKTYRRNYPDGLGYVAGVVDDITIDDFVKKMLKNDK